MRKLFQVGVLINQQGGVVPGSTKISYFPDIFSALIPNQCYYNTQAQMAFSFCAAKIQN